MTVEKKDDQPTAADKAAADKEAAADKAADEKAAKDTPAEESNSPLRIHKRDANKPADVEVGNKQEVPAWERDDAPKGSTSESLMTKDENGKDVVAGPTHYTYLADGQVIGGYGIGTHHDSGDGPVPVIATVAG